MMTLDITPDPSPASVSPFRLVRIARPWDVVPSPTLPHTVLASEGTSDFPRLLMLTDRRLSRTAGSAGPGLAVLAPATVKGFLRLARVDGRLSVRSTRMGGTGVASSPATTYPRAAARDEA